MYDYRCMHTVCNNRCVYINDKQNLVWIASIIKVEHFKHNEPELLIPVTTKSKVSVKLCPFDAIIQISFHFTNKKNIYYVLFYWQNLFVVLSLEFHILERISNLCVLYICLILYVYISTASVIYYRLVRKSEV